MKSPKSSFSRLLDVETVPDAGLSTSIEATSAECALIAAAIDIPAIEALTATFEVDRRSHGRFKIDGMVRARVTQTCVVTLDPFDCEIEAPIDATFAVVGESAHPSAMKLSRRRSHRTEPHAPAPAPVPDEAGDLPDPIIDGRIDLGGVAEEFLTLALDFYPKKPGAHFSDVVTEDTRSTSAAFAALERFKDRS